MSDTVNSPQIDEDYRREFCIEHFSMFISYICSCRQKLCLTCIKDHYHENMVFVHINDYSANFHSELVKIDRLINNYENHIYKSKTNYSENSKITQEDGLRLNVLSRIKAWIVKYLHDWEEGKNNISLEQIESFTRNKITEKIIFLIMEGMKRITSFNQDIIDIKAKEMMTRKKALVVTGRKMIRDNENDKEGKVKEKEIVHEKNESPTTNPNDGDSSGKQKSEMEVKNNSNNEKVFNINHTLPLPSHHSNSKPSTPVKCLFPFGAHAGNKYTISEKKAYPLHNSNSSGEAFLENSNKENITPNKLSVPELDKPVQISTQPHRFMMIPNFKSQDKAQNLVISPIVIQTCPQMMMQNYNNNNTTESWRNSTSSMPNDTCGKIKASAPKSKWISSSILDNESNYNFTLNYENNAAFFDNEGNNDKCNEFSRYVKLVCITCRETFQVLREHSNWRRKCEECSNALYK